MCPSCKSTNVAPETFGDGEADKIMRRMHPNAQRCGECRYVWWVMVPPRPVEPKDPTP